jgi:hypothetical protein
MIGYDVIIVGSGLHTMVLYQKLVQMKLSCLTVYLDDSDEMSYKEIVDVDEFSFSKEYQSFYKRTEIIESIDRHKTLYPDYCIALHDSIKEQLSRVFSNMKISYLPKLTKTSVQPDSSIVVVDSFDELVFVEREDGMHTIQVNDRIYEAKKLVLSSLPIASRIPQSLEDIETNPTIPTTTLPTTTIPTTTLPTTTIPTTTIPTTTPKEKVGLAFVSKLLISQKAEGCVFKLIPYLTDQSISIEIINSTAYLLSTNFTEKEAMVYFDEIASIFKVSKRRNISRCSIDDIDPTTYTFQQYMKYLYPPRRVGNLSFEHIYMKNTMVFDESNIRNSPIPIDTAYTFYILASVISIKIAAMFQKNEWLIRGSFNDWVGDKMVRIDDFQYTFVIDSNEEIQFKIDNSGYWIESYPIGDSNYTISKGRYTVYYNSITKNISHINELEGNKEWYVRGSFNDWSTQHVLLHNDSSTYEHSIILTIENEDGCEFKIDCGTWTESYPEENLTLNQGKSLIKFNIKTKEINVVMLDNSIYFFQNYHEYLFQKPQFYNDWDFQKECLGYDLLNNIF